MNIVSIDINKSICYLKLAPFLVFSGLVVTFLTMVHCLNFA